MLPFSVVYLHEVRHFDLGHVGLLLAIPALVGLVVVGPIGALIDRIGARVVVIGSLLIQMVASVLLAVTTTEAMAAAVCVLLGFSGGVAWPAINTLIATIVPSDIRQRYYGVNFTLLNLGIGIGGILGGLFVDVSRPATFMAIYLIDAATYLAPLTILLGPLRRVSGRVALPIPVADLVGERLGAVSSDAAPPAATGYRSIMRDRSLRIILALVFVGSFVGYGQLNTGAPAFGRDVGGISTQTLGWAFAANTAVIVLLQLVVLQRIEGHRRTRLIALMSGHLGAGLRRALGDRAGTGQRAQRVAVRSLPGDLRRRRVLLPTDPPGDGQRPGTRPPAGPLQRRDEHRLAVGVCRGSRGRGAARRARARVGIHRYVGRRLRAGRLARGAGRATSAGARQRGARGRLGCLDDTLTSPRLVPGTPRGGTSPDSPRAGMQQGQVGLFQVRGVSSRPGPIA